MTLPGAVLKPLDFNGFSLTGSYQGNFLVDFDIAAQFPLEAIMASAPGDFPTFVRGDPSDKVIPLHIYIDAAQASQTLIDDLKMAFTPSAGIGFLRVEDELANVRRMRVKSLGLTPWEGHDDFSYIASLHAPEPIWENDMAEGGTTALSGTAAAGNDFSVTNSGNERTFPVFAATPTAQKAIGDGYKHHWPLVIAWRSPFEGVDSLGLPYPIDITDRGFDTATLVGAGDMQADGDDLRIFLDGVEIDRYLSFMNTTGTSVWCGISFQPMRTAELASAMTAGAPANGEEIVVSNPEGTTGFPDSGAILIDNECISYRGRTFDSFLDIRRSRRGTTAAGHSATVTIYWVEHDVRMITGYTPAASPKASADRKPIIDLVASRNNLHKYNTTEGMIDPDSLRPGQWLRERRVNHLGGDGVSLQQVTGEINIRDIAPIAGAPNFDSVSVYAPCAASIIDVDFQVRHNFFAQMAAIDIEGFENIFAKFDITNPAGGDASNSYESTIQYSHLTETLAPISRFTLTGLIGNLTGSEREFGTAIAVGDSGTSRIGQSFDLRAEEPLFGASFYASKSVASTRGLTVSLYTMSDAGPSVEIANLTIATANLPTTRTKFTVNFLPGGTFPVVSPKDVNVPPGPYALVFARTAGSGTVSVWGSTKQQYSGGSRWDEQVDATWSPILTSDLGFYVTSRRTKGQADTDFNNSVLILGVDYKNPQLTFSPALAYTPKVVRGAQQAGYLLEATLENLTTDQVLTLLAPLIVDESVVKIDTDAHVVTVIYSTDDHETDALWIAEPGGQNSAGDTVRDIQEWLRLEPGANSLRYREAIQAGTNVDMTVRFRSRWT